MMKKGSGKEFTVANLSIKRGILQARLNLGFGPSDSVNFLLKGAKIPVNLIGKRVSVKTESVDDCEGYQSKSSLESNQMAGSKRKATSVDALPAKKSKQDLHSLETENETLPKEKDDVAKTNNLFADSNLAHNSKKLKKMPVEEEETEGEHKCDGEENEPEDEYECEDEEEIEESSDEDYKTEDESTLTFTSIDYDSEERDNHPRYPDNESCSVELESPGKWSKCTNRLKFSRSC